MTETTCILVSTDLVIYGFLAVYRFSWESLSDTVQLWLVGKIKLKKHNNQCSSLRSRFFTVDRHDINMEQIGIIDELKTWNE